MKALILLLAGMAPMAHADDASNVLRDPTVAAKIQDAIHASPEKQAPCKLYGIQVMTLKAIYRAISAQIQGPLVMLEPTSDLHISARDALVGVSDGQAADALATKEVFVQAKTKRFAEDFAQKIGGELHVPLTVTAATRSSKFDTDSHCGHSDGLSLDVRPLPGKVPNSWFDTNGNYDRSLNKNMIMMLVKNPQVHQIFFNDPQLLSDPDIQALIAKRHQVEGPGFEFKSYRYTYDTPSGPVTVSHDNHIHVELKPDAQIQALSQSALDSTTSH